MKKLFLLLVIVLAGLALYVRIAPSVPADWHVDPDTADDPGRSGVLLRYASSIPPETLLARFDEIAQSTPRTDVLAGSLDSGRITYVTRSKLFGFPDYVTVKATKSDSGSALIILSRLRFGVSDMGINENRLNRWLQRIDPVND